ncbi:UDP-2,4-diacetamido-2,4,6-trideoxy-beta-L-altropyranose hydrolase [Marinobacter sediminum]|uniref:UDP-2,4-diacetamido-2,4, 6-trideoxy-beta-L-altropyranose hydrolase n=1 Tax=Marinobacter sediminum TaxID=256323 RepID=UPI00202E8F81|nr:UDP-2,4-diacetamido-2,4,6-trideoxy-beta-L-altropyranose hydrolase [Marinobacter sediminum]MCM0612631.1 UDP-2,4-diacetamido-2,4,6-trideoxy-beta-L-altropyranose hydrolase [Marinobacter sediminum]
MKVVFRADASLSIGTGHVMRCLTLAEELRRQGHACQFVCRDHPGHLAGFILSKGFTCDLLSNPAVPEARRVSVNETAHSDWLGVSWEMDADQTLSVVDKPDVDWLVADHYALESRWENRLASVAKRVMVIDDLADRNHDCDLLLDQNLGSQEADYSHRVPERCVRLIGPRYALLRPEFAELREAALKRRVKPEVKRILISLGGVDSDNVTGKVLNALANSSLPGDTDLDIIMGATAPHLDEVQQMAQQLPFRAEVSVNVYDMADRMCRADLSIGAAGSTSWERCCLGLPSIMVILAENQRNIGNALAQSGCAYLVDRDRIADELSPLLSRLVEPGKELERLAANAELVCDGKGSSRLVSEMTRIIHS